MQGWTKNSGRRSRTIEVEQSGRIEPITRNYNPIVDRVSNVKISAYGREKMRGGTGATEEFRSSCK
jgi:hypothetical protein